MTTSTIQFSFTPSPQGRDRIGASADAGRSASSNAAAFEARPDAFARALQGRLNDGGSADRLPEQARSDSASERPRAAERKPERPQEAPARDPAAQASRPPQPPRDQPAQNGEKASTATQAGKTEAAGSTAAAGRKVATEAAAERESASADSDATRMAGVALPLDAALADEQADTDAEQAGNAETTIAGLPAAIAALLAPARPGVAGPASAAEAPPVTVSPPGTAVLTDAQPLTDGRLPVAGADTPAAASAEPAKATKDAALPGDAAATPRGADPAALRSGPQAAAPAASEPALPAADSAPAPQPTQPLLPAEGGPAGAHGVSVFAALRHAASAPPATPQLPVHTPTGQSAWAEDVGTQVHWMLGRAESRAELVLTPASLGKLEVSINLNGDQTTAQFVAATQAARDALEQALPRLREILQQAGINLGEASVSTSGEQGARDEGGQGRRGGGRGGEARGDSVAGAAAGWSRRQEGMVDTFA